jgi:hypothetical protein
MSAEKPEVGDVWEDSKGMVHISRIFTLSDDTRAIVFIDNNNNTVVEDSAREEHFIKMFTYLGKSKASINDLFQTEQDVSNNVAKPNSQHSEPNCNIMLKNHENFNAFAGNVKGDNR